MVSTPRFTLILCFLAGCASPLPVAVESGVNTLPTLETTIDAPPAYRAPRARISRPVEIRRYRTPVDAPALPVREIHVSTETVTVRGLDRDIISHAPRPGETKVLYLSPNQMREIVEGTPDLPDVRETFFDKLLTLTRLIAMICGMLAASLIVWSITDRLKSRRLRLL